MPDRASAAGSGDQQEGADGGYFASLAQARYMRLTTFNRHGMPVSACVPGVVDGGRAYFCARDRSGTAKRLRHAGAAQATPCSALGLCTYGPPLDAMTRQLSGEEASLAAAKLDSRCPPWRRFPIRLRRQAVYYELLAAQAAGDEDGLPAGSQASLIIRVHTRQEPVYADVATPTSLATVCTPSAMSRPCPSRRTRTIAVSMSLPGLRQAPEAEKLRSRTCPAPVIPPSPKDAQGLERHR